MTDPIFDHEKVDVYRLAREYVADHDPDVEHEHEHRFAEHE